MGNEQFTSVGDKNSQDSFMEMKRQKMLGDSFRDVEVSNIPQVEFAPTKKKSNLFRLTGFESVEEFVPTPPAFFNASKRKLLQPPLQMEETKIEKKITDTKKKEERTRRMTQLDTVKQMQLVVLDKMLQEDPSQLEKAVEELDFVKAQQIEKEKQSQSETELGRSIVEVEEYYDDEESDILSELDEIEKRLASLDSFESSVEEAVVKNEQMQEEEQTKQEEKLFEESIPTTSASLIIKPRLSVKRRTVVKSESEPLIKIIQRKSTFKVTPLEIQTEVKVEEKSNSSSTLDLELDEEMNTDDDDDLILSEKQEDENPALDLQIQPIEASEEVSSTIPAEESSSQHLSENNSDQITKPSPLHTTIISRNRNRDGSVRREGLDHSVALTRVKQVKTARSKLNIVETPTIATKSELIATQEIPKQTKVELPILPPREVILAKETQEFDIYQCFYAHPFTSSTPSMTPLVIEFDSQWIRLGFANQTTPLFTLPFCIGTLDLKMIHQQKAFAQETHYYAEEILPFAQNEIKERCLQLIPLSSLLQQQSQQTETLKLWDQFLQHVFVTKLQLACEEHPIAITFPSQMNTNIKEALVQTLMLTFDSCAISLLKRSVCIVKQLQIPTNLLINVESDFVEVIPHYEEWPLENYQLQSKKWSEQVIWNCVTKESMELKRFKKVLHPELFQQISSLCFVEEKESIEIVLPNHKSLYISSEMMQEVKNILFPTNPLQSELITMIRKVMQSMQQICPLMSNEMIQNIIISVNGASFKVTELANTLEKQIQSVFKKARVVAAVYGGKYAFEGACSMANSASFASICTVPSYFDYYGTASVKYMYF